MRRPQKKSTPARKLVWLFVLTGLVLAAWLLPPFRLQQLELAGDLYKLDGADIKRASGLVEGDHLLKGLGGSLPLWLALRYGRAEDAIRAGLPAVRDVTAKLDFPGQIRLDVAERIEVAWLAIPDGCVMIDKDGVALEIMLDPPAGIPLIAGINASSIILGQPLLVDLPETMDHAINILGAIIEADRDQRPATSLLGQVAQIRPLGGRQVYLTLTIPGAAEEITVLEQPKPDLAEDMLWLRFALDQGVLAGQGRGILDMSGNRTTFIPDP